MQKNFKIWMVGMVVIAALVVLVTGTALAQDETPSDQPQISPGWGPGHGRGLDGQVGLEAAAEVLGMTADELSAQLWGGKTLADLAEEAGVDIQDVRDAVEAAKQTAMRESIEQAVEDGTITQDHADWLLEGLEKGYLGGFGFGGRGRFHGGMFGGIGLRPGSTQLAPTGGV